MKRPTPRARWIVAAGKRVAAAPIYPALLTVPAGFVVLATWLRLGHSTGSGASPFFGVLGFDGFVHLYHGLFGHPVPYMGYANATGVVVAVLLIFGLLAFLAPPSRTDVRSARSLMRTGVVSLTLAVPMSAVIAAPPLSLVWWVWFEPHALRHWGGDLPNPRTAMFLAWLAICVAVGVLVQRGAAPRHRWWVQAACLRVALLVSAAMSLAVPLQVFMPHGPDTSLNGWLAASMYWPSFRPLHTLSFLSLLGMVLSLAACQLHARHAPPAARPRRGSWRDKPNPFACLRCGYDLRASVDADRPSCPECGRFIGRSQVKEIRRQRFQPESGSTESRPRFLR